MGKDILLMSCSSGIVIHTDVWKKWFESRGWHVFQGEKAHFI
jgi:hypothetical protein